MLLSVNLIRRGYTVRCLENSATAYQELRDFCPDILLLDIAYGDQHLTGFISALIIDVIYHLIPTIITGSFLQSNLLAEPPLNIKYFIQKPYPIDRVINAVAALTN